MNGEFIRTICEAKVVGTTYAIKKLYGVENKRLSENEVSLLSDYIKNIILHDEGLIDKETMLETIANLDWDILKK